MNKRINQLLIFTVLAFALVVNAQHRGDNLAFQGVAQSNQNSVRATAMGGAFTGISGDVGAIYWNPAGLSGLSGLQVSISAASVTKMWQENQDYRPNRFQMTLPFYLEGLYIPNPQNNGLWDYDIFQAERDSSYYVSPPILGKDRYDEAVADWQKKQNEFKLDNFAVAYPFKIGEKTLTLAGAYSRKFDVMDYDRNDTFLDPHIGYDYYGVAERVTNDTLRMNWSQFERSRFGSINNISLAASYDISKNIVLGLGLNSFSGESDDMQRLDKVGWFDITSNNKFRFSYDTLNTNILGSSSFKGLNANLGFLLKLEHISFGVNLTTPYTMQRDWETTTTVIDTSGTTTSSASGVEKMKVPLAYRVGLCIAPIEKFRVSLDVESIPYSNNEFEFAMPNTTHRNWVDLTSLRFGAEYKPWTWLSLMAGYKAISEVFVPDGAAFRDRGPTSESYTMGASIYALSGRFDIAYEIRSLKYYDSYYSNTNFVLEKMDWLMFGYTFFLDK
jgi:hypothetical protein